MAVAPTLRGCPEGGFVLRPIVQARRIEVGAGEPNQDLNFRIKADLSEHGGCRMQKRGMPRWAGSRDWRKRVKTP